MMGGEALIYAMYEEPDLIQRFLEYICDWQCAFYQEHMQRVPVFHGGYAVGQYHIWSPGRNFRTQEDAVAILSPNLFGEFVIPKVKRMTSLSEYSVMHLHLTSNHVLDQVLAIESIRAVEYDIDAGSANARQYIAKMKEIQNAGKCLIIKSEFGKEDIDIILNELDTQGLCLMPVVFGQAEMENIANCLNM